MLILNMARQIAARGLHLPAQITGGLALVERAVVVKAVPGGEAFAAAQLGTDKLFLGHHRVLVVPVVFPAYGKRITHVLVGKVGFLSKYLITTEYKISSKKRQARDI